MDPEEDCRQRRLVYQIRCQNCQEDPDQDKEVLYIGTLGHLHHKRMREHMTEVRQGRSSNALLKHQRISHPGQNVNFISKTVRSNIRYNLDRYVLEGYRIHQASQNQGITLMNSCSEWGHKGITRMAVQT